MNHIAPFWKKRRGLCVENNFKKKDMKTHFILFAFTLCLTFPLFAQPLHYGGCWLRDDDGSYFNPKGYVIVMEDGKGKFDYSEDDYRRMTRYGANTQVIRLGIGFLAGLEGEEERENYLERVDMRVNLAKNVGMKTAFKMTVYGLRGFNRQWGKMYDINGEFRKYLFEAWDQIWSRYADESSVIAYDLLNEPYRESKQVSYVDATQDRLIPLYIDLINKMKSYSSKKWAIYQPLLIDNDEKADSPNKMPMMRIDMPDVYDRMIFSPHPYYFPDNCEFGVKRHQMEVRSSHAALMFGEWGHPVTAETDSVLSEQLRFTQWYAQITSIFDTAGVGLIKPWFTGTRQMRSITWSIFSDTSATGSVERKYLMDVICRPYPLVMAGCMVEEYGFTFTNRTFHMTFKKNSFPSGYSEIYLPEERHYPDGFTVIYNDEVMLARDKGSPTGLKVLKTVPGFHMNSFKFEESTQRLIILDWNLEETNNSIKIVPGIKNY